MICMKNLRFLVAQEQKLGARDHRAMLEHRPVMTGLGISIHCLQPQEFDNPLICSLHRFVKKIFQTFNRLSTKNCIDN